MKLTEHGRPCAAIYTETEEFAAQELQRYLKEISGAELPIYRSDIPASKPLVVIGASRRFPSSAAGLKDQDYIVKATGAKLILAGGNRSATLHSVYTFLEEYMGCAWCGLGSAGETIPRRTTIAIRNIRRRYKPDLPFRAISDTDIWHNIWYVNCPHRDEDGAKTIRMLDWMTRNRMNTAVISQGMFRDHHEFIMREAVEKRGLRLCVGMHDLVFWFPYDRYRKTNPEYFAMLAATGKRQSHQLCLSNPAVARIVADNIVRFLDKYPGADMLGLGQSDGSGWCVCPACLKMEGGERYGFNMGKVKGMHLLPKTYLTFCNRVVAGVTRKYPRQRFFALCYGTSVEPPLDKSFKTHPNLDLNVAFFRRFDRPLDQGFSLQEDAWLTRMEKAWYTEFPRMLRQWRRVAKGAIFSHMYHMGQHDNLAKPVYLSVPRDMALYRKIGLQGYYSQAATESFEIYGLTYYIAARSAFDTKLTAEQLIAQYCRGYYGKAAGVMQKYHVELGHALAALPDDVKAAFPRILHAFGEPPENIYNAAALLALKPDLIDRAQELLKKALTLPTLKHERKRLKKQAVVLRYTRQMGELVALCESSRINFKQARFDEGIRLARKAQAKLKTVRQYVEKNMHESDGLCDLMHLDKIVKAALAWGWGREFFKRPDAYYPDHAFVKSKKQHSKGTI